MKIRHAARHESSPHTLATPPRRRGGQMWGATASRVAFWVLVASGPLVGGLALAASSATARSETAPVPVEVPGEVEGLAVRFVVAWLEAERPEDLARFVTSTPSSADMAATVVSAAVPVSAVATVDGWRVTVAVASRAIPAGLFVAVPVAGGPAGWSVAGWPAEVTDPARSSPGEPARLEPPRPDDARLVAADRWLRAYLTGSGELARYTSPDWEGVAPIDPAPYRSFEVVGYAVADTDPERPVVTVDVVAEASGAGERSLSYTLALAARDGRWEVAGLFPNPGDPTTPAPPAGAAASTSTATSRSAS